MSRQHEHHGNRHHRLAFALIALGFAIGYTARAVSDKVTVAIKDMADCCDDRCCEGGCCDADNPLA